MKFKDFNAVEQVEICNSLLKVNKYPQYKDIEFAKEIKSIKNIGRFFDFMEEVGLTSYFAIYLFIESEGVDKKEQEELKAKCLEFNRKCKINLFKF